MLGVTAAGGAAVTDYRVSGKKSLLALVANLDYRQDNTIRCGSTVYRLPAVRAEGYQPIRRWSETSGAIVSSEAYVCIEGWDFGKDGKPRRTKKLSRRFTLEEAADLRRARFIANIRSVRARDFGPEQPAVCLDAPTVLAA